MKLFCIVRYISNILNVLNVIRTKRLVLNSNHDVSNYDGFEVADMRKKGFSLSESALYDLKHNDYREYVSTWEAYQPRMRQNPYFILSDDKYLFSMVFGKFIEVPKTYGLIEFGKIIPIDLEGINEDSIYDVIISMNGAVIKDKNGYNGYGVKVFDVKEKKLFLKGKIITKEQLSDILKEYKSGIIQSRIYQGEFENTIFDGSVNTIRVISMRNKNDLRHEIVCATQRIGTKISEPVDNFSQGGLSALIDLDTGELSSATSYFTVDDKNNRIFVDKHPDSNAQIKGLVVPRWEEIKKQLVTLSDKLPYFEYIAYDVVLKDDGIALIEANMKSSIGHIQVHGGVRNALLGQKYREHGYLFG